MSANRRWLTVGITAAAVVAVAAVIALRLRRPGEADVDTGLSPQAHLALKIIVDHAATQAEVPPGGRVLAGDTIHFELTHAQGGYVAVVALTGDPSVRIFSPHLKSSIHLPGPGKTLIPDTAVVDEQAGKQRIVALLCPTEVLPLRLGMAGRRAAIDHPNVDDIDGLKLPCAQAAVTIERVFAQPL